MERVSRWDRNAVEIVVVQVRKSSGTVRRGHAVEVHAPVHTETSISGRSTDFDTIVRHVENSRLSESNCSGSSYRRGSQPPM